MSTVEHIRQEVTAGAGEYGAIPFAEMQEKTDNMDVSPVTDALQTAATHLAGLLTASKELSQLIALGGEREVAGNDHFNTAFEGEPLARSGSIPSAISLMTGEVRADLDAADKSNVGMYAELHALHNAVTRALSRFQEKYPGHRLACEQSVEDGARARQRTRELAERYTDRHLG
jgi:hypothetical protein